MSIKPLTIIFFISSSFLHAQELSVFPDGGIPASLAQGLALYLDHHLPETFLEEYKSTLQTLPSLQQLENASDELMAAYLFIEFIDTQWNRETLLNLLNNYSDFENILQFRKEDVERYWHYSTLFKTYGFKSGDHAISLIMDELFNTFEKALNIPQKYTLSFTQEEIRKIFDTYKQKLEELDSYILIVIKTNTEIAGWALFAVKSESNIVLEALCIHPDYKKQNIYEKLIAVTHQKFRTIKSIITVNKNIHIKSSYFCGTLNL